MTKGIWGENLFDDELDKIIDMSEVEEVAGQMGEMAEQLRKIYTFRNKINEVIELNVEYALKEYAKSSIAWVKDTPGFLEVQLCSPDDCGQIVAKIKIDLVDEFNFFVEMIDDDDYSDETNKLRQSAAAWADELEKIVKKLRDLAERKEP